MKDSSVLQAMAESGTGICVSCECPSDPNANERILYCRGTFVETQLGIF